MRRLILLFSVLVFLGCRKGDDAPSAQDHNVIVLELGGDSYQSCATNVFHLDVEYSETYGYMIARSQFNCDQSPLQLFFYSGGDPLQDTGPFGAVLKLTCPAGFIRGHVDTSYEVITVMGDYVITQVDAEHKRVSGTFEGPFTLVGNWGGTVEFERLVFKGVTYENGLEGPL